MDDPGGTPTINQVATRAGVSISTVSRVLNGLNRVHPATRRRVQQVIDELGYQPSALARGLALQRTQVVGLIIPSATDAFYSEIVRGVEDAAAALDYALLIRSQPWQTTGERPPQVFTPRQVDGLVLVGVNVDSTTLAQLRTRGLRIAVVQEDLGGDVPTFTVDNYGGAQTLARHLVGHGYRRIAFITGSDNTPDSADRLRALRDVLDQHSLALPDHYVERGDYLRGSGYAAMSRLLDQAEHPDAVFAANDQMAADALRAIHERGRRVPQDIAVVGFDDIALASYTEPPLTTVRQPAYQLGRLAVEALIGCPAGAPARRVVLAPEMIVRDSCGCVTRSTAFRGPVIAKGGEIADTA